MNNKEYYQNLVWVLLSTDVRLQFHSLDDEVDGIFNHTNKCPRCCAFYILGLEQEMVFSEKLSTVK